MTHTVADAEAAIRRHPECLETLSKSADLLMELGDPRGEHFSLCLQGVLGVEAMMRLHPQDTSAMFVAAWRLAQLTKCLRCDGNGWERGVHHYDRGRYPCEECNQTGEGKGPLWAEGLRLLAECGKVGRPEFGYGRMFRRDTRPYYAISDEQQRDLPCRVSYDWFETACPNPGKKRLGIVEARLRLLAAYARASPDERRRWAAETRELAADAASS